MAIHEASSEVLRASGRDGVRANGLWRHHDRHIDILDACVEPGRPNDDTSHGLDGADPAICARGV
ncbi:MAG TPA: hypothetical protein VFC03_13660 [Acidimicrobiales bacterium]|nr:hypothetical protein [Acidimicrobiales bacterium]